MTELLPELVTAVQTKGSVQQHVAKIDDDAVRKKMMVVCKKFKI